jgi:hypothetical protein
MSSWLVTLRRVIADDCSFVDSSGTVSGKAELLHAVAAHDIRATSWKFDDIRVRVYKKAAIVSGRVGRPTSGRGNRTVHGPSREKRSIACLRRSAGHFLWSGFREGIVELRRFPAIFGGMQPRFSATQTVWRREQNSNSQYSFLGCSKRPCVSHLLGFRPTVDRTGETNCVRPGDQGVRFLRPVEWRRLGDRRAWRFSS